MTAGEGGRRDRASLGIVGLADRAKDRVGGTRTGCASRIGIAAAL